jgi:hypothetical protein
MLVTIATIGIVLTVSGVALLLMDWLLERRGIAGPLLAGGWYSVRRGETN